MQIGRFYMARKSLNPLEKNVKEQPDRENRKKALSSGHKTQKGN